MNQDLNKSEAFAPFAPNSVPMTNAHEFLESITGLAVQIQALQQEALAQITPIAAGILRQRTTNVALIERTLDQLLDVCSTPAAVDLYRRLCRHYWDIDPNATASYVHAYREMWDVDAESNQDAAA